MGPAVNPGGAEKFTFILDIGKTHIKAHLLDARGHSVCVRETANRVIHAGDYPHYDTEAIWCFLLAGLTEFNRQHPVGAIAVTTHGAAAALVDRTRGGDGLVLPVLDYEYPAIESVSESYDAQRPPFAETGSPALPAGLNLGRQLAWLQAEFPAAFAAASDILLYPQYWVWRLCGARVSERSSLGCHTDLWLPWQGQYSPLVSERGWDAKFPSLANAWDCVGRVAAELAAQTGLAEVCEVYTGVHDSNASYLRYRKALPDAAFSVVSTGTWSIVMDASAGQEALQADRDMLANVDVFGRPFVCSRFMGGREFQAVCEHLGGATDQPCTAADVAALIAADILCLPAWQRGCGPFGGQLPKVQGYVSSSVVPSALASLYCALMLDYQLDLVASSGEIIIGGAFLKNPLICALLAQLRAPQRVLRSADLTGTVLGTAMLANWEEPAPVEQMQPVSPAKVRGLASYRDNWRQRVEQREDEQS